MLRSALPISSPLHPILSHVCSRLRVHRGNIQAHGPPFCLPSAGPGRAQSRGWPLIGCDSFRPIWLALTYRGVVVGGGVMVWNLEETRDCYRTQKSWDTATAVKAFLSTSALCWLWSAIFHLCTVYLLGQSTQIHVHSSFFFISVRKYQAFPAQKEKKMQEMNTIYCS